MKGIFFAALAALATACGANGASANIGQFTGQWVNLNPMTQGVTRIVISTPGGPVRVHAFGQCSPTDCDWGAVDGRPFGPHPGANALGATQSIMARINAGFANKFLVIERIGPDRLQVKVFTDFIDNSGRQDYVRTHTFRRAAGPGPGMPPGPGTPPGPGPGSPPGPVAEDCVSFNPMTVQANFINGDWKLVDGSHWIKSFGNKAGEANRAAQIVRSYQATQLCFVGRPGPSMEYLKRGNGVPVGPRPLEDCVGFNPNAASVQPMGGNFRIVEGNHAIMMFPNQAEAEKGLAVLRMHQVRFQCFVGRPNPSFTYMRR